MKRIITTALIILTIGSTFILYKEKAQAQTNCRIPSKEEDPANHANAYNDGYRQGVESARKGEQYRPRGVGGNFALGFKDGYEGRNVADSNKPQAALKCEQLSTEPRTQPGTNSFKAGERNQQWDFNQRHNQYRQGVESDRLYRENRRRKKEGLPPKLPTVIPSSSEQLRAVPGFP